MSIVELKVEVDKYIKKKEGRRKERK